MQWNRWDWSKFTWKPPQILNADANASSVTSGQASVTKELYASLKAGRMYFAWDSFAWDSFTWQTDGRSNATATITAIAKVDASASVVSKAIDGVSQQFVAQGAAYGVSNASLAGLIRRLVNAVGSTVTNADSSFVMRLSGQVNATILTNATAAGGFIIVSSLAGSAISAQNGSVVKQLNASSFGSTQTNISVLLNTIERLFADAHAVSSVILVSDFLLQILVDEEWKVALGTYIKVDGTWKEVLETKVMDGGKWKTLI